jgi:hypothetical protein
MSLTVALTTRRWIASRLSGEAMFSTAWNTAGDCEMRVPAVVTGLRADEYIIATGEECECEWSQKGRKEWCATKRCEMKT